MGSIAQQPLAPERDPRLVEDARGKTQISASPESGPGAIGLQSTALIHYLIAVRGGIPGTMFRLTKGVSCMGRGAENPYKSARAPSHDATQ